MTESSLVIHYINVCKQNPLWKKPGGDLQADMNYLRLGLLAEIGEVAEIYQKHIRDGAIINKEDVLDELGDVCFYVHMLAYIGYGNIESCKKILSAGITPLIFDRIQLLYILDTTNIESVYITMLSIGASYGYSLQDIMNANIAKLKRRLKNNTIKGSGSHR